VARRYVLRHAATLMEHEIDNGSGWLYEADNGEPADDNGETDAATQRRRLAALRALVDELRRRARGAS
jgi:hypothetical protein